MTRLELEDRIQALLSKQKRVGPYRAAGIQRSIDCFKAKLSALASETSAQSEGRQSGPKGNAQNISEGDQ